MPDPLIASFVLRFMLDQEAGAGSKTWRGVIRHIQTNDELHFSGLHEALTFIQRFVDIADSELPFPELSNNDQK